MSALVCFSQTHLSFFHSADIYTTLQQTVHLSLSLSSPSALGRPHCDLTAFNSALCSA